MMNLSLFKKMAYALIIIALLSICIPTIKTFAVSDATERLVLQRDTELLDNKGQEIGMKINKGHELSLHKEIIEIDGVNYRQTVFQANLVKIKIEACDIDNDGFAKTDRKTIVFDLNDKIIGEIDANVEIGMAEIEGEECIFSIEGFIKEEAFVAEIKGSADPSTKFIIDLIVKIFQFLLNNLIKPMNLF